jgi:exodeoxyribonuclease-3
MDWVDEYRPDVLLLQELKCEEQQFPLFELDNLGYNVEIFGQKARNGVAILSKFPIYGTSRGLLLDGQNYDNTDSRYMETHFDLGGKTIKIASIYAPNGGPTVKDMNSGIDDVKTTESFVQKLDFFDKLAAKLRESVVADEIAFFGGDYNICPNLHMDVYTTKKDGNITCTEEEREKFRGLLDVGVSDVWRKLNPELIEYSWWGYRPYFMWEKNQGFRLDAILTTPAATNSVLGCKIYSKETRGKEKASDHAPMMCEVNFP